MAKRKTTPLKKNTIEGHHCTLDVRIDKLSAVPFFHHLDTETLTQLNSAFSAHHAKMGDVIYYQEEPAVYLRILVFGAVRLLHHTDDGKDILIDLLKPGEYFGSLPLLGDDHYQENAYAHTDCCIMIIDQGKLNKILHNHPETAVKMISVTANKLKTARNTILNLSNSSIEQRVAAILLMLARKFGEETNGQTLIQIPLSRKNIADIAGTATETISRIMSRFQQEGLIQSGRQWVSITDFSGLKNISGE